MTALIWREIIDKNLAALDKKHLEQEKLNLELTVPIKLPPGGKKATNSRANFNGGCTNTVKLEGDCLRA